MHIFVALSICFRTPFVCLLNDFTDSEVYSYLIMDGSVYNRLFNLMSV